MEGAFSEAGSSAYAEASADRRSVGGGWLDPACPPDLKVRPPKTYTVRPMKPAFAVLSLALIVSSACSTFTIKSDRCPAYVPTTPVAGAVKVQYLGVGGYLVQRGDDVVLFSPQYTNPAIIEVAFEHQIRTDRALIDQMLPAEADKAAAIVIGHAHYDHLMDTPYIATTRAQNAKVYGSATMINLIGSEVPRGRMVDVAPNAAAKTPIKINDRLRLWTIPSQHVDQTRLKSWLLGIDVAVHMWRGTVTKPMSRPPATASEWPEGEVYAYVLDFMDATGTTVEFRLYYQDAPTDEPTGYPFGDHAPTDNRRIDAALIVAGDSERQINHPRGIVSRTKPRFLVVGHWENFFEPQTDICRTGVVDAIPRSDVRAVMAKSGDALKAARQPGKPILPCPTASVVHFPVDSSNDAAVHDALKKSRVTYNCGR